MMSLTRLTSYYKIPVNIPVTEPEVCKYTKYDHSVLYIAT